MRRNDAVRLNRLRNRRAATAVVLSVAANMALLLTAPGWLIYSLLVPAAAAMAVLVMRSRRRLNATCPPLG